MSWWKRTRVGQRVRFQRETGEVIAILACRYGPVAEVRFDMTNVTRYIDVGLLDAT